MTLPEEKAKELDEVNKNYIYSLDNEKVKQTISKIFPPELQKRFGNITKPSLSSNPTIEEKLDTIAILKRHNSNTDYYLYDIPWSMMKQFYEETFAVHSNIIGILGNGNSSNGKTYWTPKSGGKEPPHP